MVLFVGQSSEFYGRYAAPMSLVEIGVLVSSAALLAVYFLPAIRLHFAAKTRLAGRDERKSPE